MIYIPNWKVFSMALIFCINDTAIPSVVIASITTVVDALLGNSELSSTEMPTMAADIPSAPRRGKKVLQAKIPSYEWMSSVSICSSPAGIFRPLLPLKGGRTFKNSLWAIVMPKIMNIIDMTVS